MGLFFFVYFNIIHRKMTDVTTEQKEGILKQLSWEKFLELDHLSLSLFVTTQFEMLGPLDGNLKTAFTLSTFQTKDQLLGSFCLKGEKNPLKIISIQIFRKQENFRN